MADPSNPADVADPSNPRKCTAKAKSGKPCQRWAVQGGKVCPSHGGRAPQVKAAAARNIEHAAAQKAVATYGLPVTVDPLDALLGELHRTAGHVAWLGALVAELDSVMVSSEFGTWPSAWVDLYQKERAHLAKVARDCLASGVEERRVRLAEDQGRMVADVIRRVIVGLGLDPTSTEAREVVRRELTLIAA